MQQLGTPSTSSASDMTGSSANNPLSTSLFTSRRVSYTIAGAFAFVASAAAINAASTVSAPQTSSAKVQHGMAASTPSQSNATMSNDVSAATTSDASGASTQITVNGQDIPVSATGTTQQTITSADGSQILISTSTTSSSKGAATNSNNTDISLHVTSTSGGTASP